MVPHVIAPGVFDVYVVPDKGYPLELVWKHAVPGLGELEVSLRIVRSQEETVLRMIRQRGIYMGEDAHGSPIVSLRLTTEQAQELHIEFQRTQNRRENIYERPAR